LFDSGAIAGRVEALAGEIRRSLGEVADLVIVLKGGFVFAADLIRALSRAGMRLRVDFVALSSYRDRTRSAGEVEIRAPTTLAFAGRSVLLVDDILQTGRTLAKARSLLLAQGAKNVRICVLLAKEGAERSADFVGFRCPDRFVVGYGLDYAQSYRQLPFIGTLET
jgi:hypoxanthine phosphoribosyltransferase